MRDVHVPHACSAARMTAQEDTSPAPLTRCVTPALRADSPARQAPARLQQLVDLGRQAVKVALRDELALHGPQRAAAGVDRRRSLPLAVHQVHAQQRRQVHLREHTVVHARGEG